MNSLSLRSRQFQPKPVRLIRAALAVALGVAFALPLSVSAQAVTSAFTYQGELRVAGNPANANFDLEFRLFNADSGGTQIGPVVTRTNVPAVNGLFNVQLDFGAGQFAGERQWLEVRIKPAGSGSFETLSPRTEVTATPYALGAVAALANSVSTTSIVDGTIGTADIDATQVQRRVTGSCPSGEYVRVVAQDGTVTCGTDATGSGTVTSVATGAGLTGGPITTTGTVSIASGGVTGAMIATGAVGSTQIADGSIAAADIDATQVQRRVTGSCPSGEYVRVVAQDGTVTCGTDATGSGTVTSVATGAGLTGGPITTTGTVSIASGGVTGAMIATGAVGSTQIADGSVGAVDINDTQVQRRVTGTCTGTNYVQLINADGTVGCGAGPVFSGWTLTGNAGTNPATNFIGTTDAQPFVVRTRNVPSLRIEPSTVLFGGNPITANVIAGSSANEVTAGVRGATIAGGGVPSGDSDPDFIGEAANRVTDSYGTIGGGYGNRAGSNDIAPDNAAFATVAGGRNNSAEGPETFIGGGVSNVAAGSLTVVGGGRGNLASGTGSVIGGGTSNRATGDDSSLTGGNQNVAAGPFSVVGGGIFNEARGVGSTVLGGFRNCAGAEYSFAGGNQAKVRPSVDPGGSGSCSGLTYPGSGGDVGTFVWADSQGTNFVSTGPNQFLVRAAGGMAINTNAPRSTLTVTGTDQWNPTIGNGWGDFTVGDATRGLAVGVSLSGGGAGTVRLWGKGGTENIIFTSATNPSFDTLVVASAGRAGVRRFPAVNAFEVEGNASKTTAGDWLANSDARIKTEVAPVTGAVERILRLRPVTFRYTEDYRALHPSVGDGVYWNVIAQEYAAVFPEAVKGSGEYLPGFAKTAENEILQVDLHPATVTTIAAVQELAVRLEAAESENAELRGELERREAAYRARHERLARDNAELRTRLDLLETHLLNRATRAQ